MKSFRDLRFPFPFAMQLIVNSHRLALRPTSPRLEVGIHLLQRVQRVHLIVERPLQEAKLLKNKPPKRRR